MSSTSSTLTCSQKLYVGMALSKAYHCFRPSHPPAVLEAILDFLAAGYKRSSKPSQMAKQYSLAVDMACGTGQATRPLAEHFDKVIGCDVSDTQIEEAICHNQLANIEFHVARCEDMSMVQDGSVDLVTCAAGFHWVDADATYREVNRILRPGGVLAIYSYGRTKFDTKEAQDAFEQFFDANFRQYAPALPINIVFNEYSDLNLPFADVTRNNDIRMERDVPLSSFIGQLKSYGSYQALLREHPGSNVLQELSDRLKSILAPGAAASDDPIVHQSCSYFVVMGRK